MTQRILQLFLTGLLGLASSISQAQVRYVFDTIQTDPNSALSHSYRERSVSNQSVQKEFEAGLDQFWIAYAAGLRKAMEENDNARAADILKNMRAELRPLYKQLLSTGKYWKKTHTAAELKTMKDWCRSNPYKSEALLLEADYKLQVRSELSKPFQRAYLNLKKSIAFTD